jgi:dihydropyrimidinase
MGRGDFRKIPNGLPGVEERVDLMHQAVVDGRMTKERWVEVCSTTPAKLFGMPKKGSITAGCDADIVVYDPNRKQTLSASTHHMDVDYSCYEGMEIQGGSDVVMSRGTVVVRNGEWTGPAGHGKFVKRTTADYARQR